MEVRLGRAIIKRFLFRERSGTMIFALFLVIFWVKSECPDACLRQWIGDGKCNDACYHEDCYWDLGDCDVGCDPAVDGTEWITNNAEMAEILRRVYSKNETVTIVGGNYVPNYDFKKQDRSNDEKSFDASLPGYFYPWDPLKEVLVGRIEQAMVPELEPEIIAVFGYSDYPIKTILKHKGKMWKDVHPKLYAKWQVEVNNWVKILKKEGIKVHRPLKIDLSKPIVTENWKAPNMLDQIYNRDIMLVIGNHFFPSRMPWRSRHGEIKILDKLFDYVAKKGAHVHKHPPAKLRTTDYNMPAVNSKYRGYLPKRKWPSKDCKFIEMDDYEVFIPVINNNEYLFDGPDFYPIGNDIFTQFSHVTNLEGIKYVSKIVGDAYRFHILPTDPSTDNMHIDTTFVPIGPKLAVVTDSELSISKLPSYFHDWKIIPSPKPERKWKRPVFFDDPYLSVNSIILGEKVIAVSPAEKTFIKILKDNGFRVVEAPLLALAFLGGGQHCSTNDVVRKHKMGTIFNKGNVKKKK